MTPVALKSSSTPTSTTFTVFKADERVGHGSITEMALLYKRQLESDTMGSVLIFDDETGRSIDFDYRGSDDEVVRRVSQMWPEPPREVTDEAGEVGPDHVGRGRPKLGVIAREVTLLPRHWDWLNNQPGGASVALRRLVEEGRRANAAKDQIRKNHERAYNFMSAMAGNFAGFEEATRALFAHNAAAFSEQTEEWPSDVRDHVFQLAFGDGVL